MFNFRIIELQYGNQVIDRNLKTPYSALTPLQMVEYVEMEVQLAIMDAMERKSMKEAERRRRIASNPLYRLACVIGLL